MNEFESDWISLSQSQSGVRGFWVNLREDKKVSESKMAVSGAYMVEFKMAAFIILSQNEWLKIFCANGGNQSWQVWVSLRRKTKMAESKMATFKMAAIIRSSENDEFESDWISLSQSQSGVRVFWENLREDTKVSESKMAESKSNRTDFKMAAIIKLRQNEWVKVYYVQIGPI